MSPVSAGVDHIAANGLWGGGCVAGPRPLAHHFTELGFITPADAPLAPATCQRQVLGRNEAKHNLAVTQHTQVQPVGCPGDSGFLMYHDLLHIKAVKLNTVAGGEAASKGLECALCVSQTFYIGAFCLARKIRLHPVEVAPVQPVLHSLCRILDGLTHRCF